MIISFKRRREQCGLFCSHIALWKQRWWKNMKEKERVYLFGGMSGACSLRDGRARYRRRKRGIEINLAAAQLNLDDSSLLIHNKCQASFPHGEAIIQAFFSHARQSYDPFIFSVTILVCCCHAHVFVVSRCERVRKGWVLIVGGGLGASIRGIFIWRSRVTQAGGVGCGLLQV